MLPVIAIVGRPNVGKSTLFNCLTRTRDALITDYPGTTRDRQYGEVERFDRHFIIIDTGGMTEKKNEVDNLITAQAWQAIEEADQLLFLIDARSGILPEDRLLANMLRQSGKKICLVINKTEGLNPDTYLSDAYEFGFSTPVFIAAAHGTGISTLIETLFPLPISTDTEQDTEPESFSAIKLAVIGRPNVGKSTLINRMLGETRVIVHDSPGTTRDSIYIPLERLDQHYILIDTAGVRRRKNITELPEKFSIVKTLQAIEDAHIILYVIDGRIGVTEQDLKLLGFTLDCGKGLVIAVNKWDGMTEETRKQTRLTLDRQLDFTSFARIHYISALHGSGVGNLFDSINEAYASATILLSTPVLTRLLEKAQETHSPPLVHGRRVKLRYAHPGGHNPPQIIIHGNQLEALPESYRRFLEHFFQHALNLHGTPVRITYKTSKNPYQKQ